MFPFRETSLPMSKKKKGKETQTSARDEHCLGEPPHKHTQAIT